MKLPVVELDKSESAIRECLMEGEFTPLIITKGGKAIAALVPLAGSDIETASLALDKRFLAIIERGRKQRKARGSISLEALEESFR